MKPRLTIIALTLTAVVILFPAVRAAAQDLPDELKNLTDPEQFEKLQERIQQEIEQVGKEQESGGKTIDLTYWVASFIFGLLGLAMFIYGKKRADYKFLGGGLLLMIYPYFIHSGVYVVITGIAILGLVVAAGRFI